MAQKMKKSVSELQQDLTAANTMIAGARRSGNNRDLNLGRERRLEAWRELRDEHKRSPPPHIAKELERRYGKANTSKREPEFRAPREEVPSSNEMVFTARELYGSREATKLARVDARNLSRTVDGWLTGNEEYQKLAKTLDYLERRASGAAEAISLISGRMHLSDKDKQNLSTLLNNAYTARRRAAEVGREMASLADNLREEFRDSFPSNPKLLEEYGKRVAALKSGATRLIANSLPRAEDTIARRIGHTVMQLRPIQETSDSAISSLRLEEQQKKSSVSPDKAVRASLASEAKERLLGTMLRSMPPPRRRTSEERELAERLESAAKDPWVSTEDFLKIADLSPSEAQAIQIAFLGAPTRARTPSGTAVAMRKAASGEEPVAIARREPGEERPGRIARADTSRRKKKPEA